MALEKISFRNTGYHGWLKRKIQGMKDALSAGQSFEHMAGDMLERKLSAYEKELKEIEK